MTAPKRTRTKTAAAPSYDASALDRLEGLDAVRKRPAMYVHDTGTRGLTHCAIEIFDNSIDEALAGHAGHVTVTAHADGSVSVGDDGRGIPVDIEPKSGLPGVIFVMVNLHAGGKFGGDGYKVSGGLHGVGASVVNALSERVDVEVDRGGVTWGVSFRRGEPGQFDSKGNFKAGTQLRRVAKIAKKVTGTRLRFWPDMEIFEPEAELDWERVAVKAATTAYLVPGLRITVVDERGDDRVVTEHHAPGGIVELVDAIAGDDALTPTIHITGVGTFTERAKMIEGDKLVSKDVERPVTVEIALRWGKQWDYSVRSFANVVETHKGGTHVNGFERALVKTVGSALTSTRVLKANEESPGKDDILEGLTAVVSVHLPEPQFEGQTKEILGSSQVTGIVAGVVGDQLGVWFGASRNKAAAKAVFEKVAEASRARHAARSQRDLIRRKSALESASMPDKLKDCHSDDSTLTELFIIEGDSAAGTVGAARDSRYQAYLPIRGKILNVLRASEREMLDNKECAALITAVGAGSGRTFDLERARYDKLIILADADVDGSHIRCLLLTLCWKHMRPFVEAGRVYAAMPPLFHVQLSGGGDAWAYNDADLKVRLEELESSGKKVRHIQRMKGLGEMSATQLAVTTVESETRRLRRVTIADVKAADALFTTLMGNDVADRKAFIYDRADGFDLGSLDL